MINIHLCNDEKFTNFAIKRFEKEYPEQNIFLINKKNDEEVESISSKDKVEKFDFTRDEIIEFIYDVKNEQEDLNIFFHYLNFSKSLVFSKLINRIEFKSYWIFYGGDLYNRLYKSGRFEMYDDHSGSPKIYKKLKETLRVLYVKIFQSKEEKLAEKFIENLDFFCFWNHSDFLLLKQNYRTKAKNKWFIYDAMYNFDTYFGGYKDETKKVLVNHSSARSGNHITILKKLNSATYKKNISELIVPLNYGNEKNKSIVDNFCSINFKGQYSPILNFLKEEDYFQIISDVDIAIFGNRRQQAGANVIYLLAMGTKVFLRESNTLLSYFRSQGVKLFSFEKDFNEDSLISPLPIDIQKQNRQIILKLFSESSLDSIYYDLI